MDRRHGKTLEEGASGFLGKKLAITAGSEVARDNMGTDWDKFAELCSDKSNLDGISFGSKEWASVYLASTPQQAAELGLNFPGVDEVRVCCSLFILIICCIFAALLGLDFRSLYLHHDVQLQY